MKLKLKYNWFDAIEEIKAVSTRVIENLKVKDFQEAIQKWWRRWDLCLYAGGYY
jgi:hypothetical protein